MSLMRAGSVGRHLYRQCVCVCASRCLHGAVPSLPVRKPLHAPPVPRDLLQGCPVLQAASTRCYSVELDEVRFEQVSDETLESLSEVLEEAVARDAAPQDCDVLYSTGVLTLQLGTFGTYVINKQTPNRQIWLSSPVSGPKRFDFVGGAWVYRRTGHTLHGLLGAELAKVLPGPVDLLGCAFGRSEAA